MESYETIMKALDEMIEMLPEHGMSPQPARIAKNTISEMNERIAILESLIRNYVQLVDIKSSRITYLEEKIEKLEPGGGIL